MQDISPTRSTLAHRICIPHCSIGYTNSNCHLKKRQSNSQKDFPPQHPLQKLRERVRTYQAHTVPSMSVPRPFQCVCMPKSIDFIKAWITVYVPKYKKQFSNFHFPSNRSIHFTLSPYNKGLTKSRHLPNSSLYKFNQDLWTCSSYCDKRKSENCLA